MEDAAPICARCHQLVDVKGGLIVTHWRDGTSIQCPASFREARAALWRGGPRDREALLKAAEHSRQQRIAQRKAGALARPLEDPTPLEAPSWLPLWSGEHLPAIVLPARSPVGMWLPGRSRTQQYTMLARLLPTTRSLIWSELAGHWTFSVRHALDVTRKVARRNQLIILGREYNPREKCTSSCQRAAEFTCTCTCLAKFHGGGRWMKGLRVVDGFDARRENTSWYWTVFSFES
ncbi:hypothetical protein ACFVVU_38720 [Kitasatospora sp. NPDC057965]|uniref:hypothetical protein n=1 Tax=Kitasatospora sp. NPDC057965 TaxID=3346291 RepID=UPI0036DF5D5D